MVNVVDSSCLSQLKVQMNFLTELVFSKKKKTKQQQLLMNTSLHCHTIYKHN